MKALLSVHPQTLKHTKDPNIPCVSRCVEHDGALRLIDNRLHFGADMATALGSTRQDMYEVENSDY